MHWAPLTVKEEGTKLPDPESETMNPTLTSGPPADRPCQLWLAVPVMVPEAETAPKA